MKKVYLIIITLVFLNTITYSQFWVEQNSGVTVNLTSGSVVSYGNIVWVSGYNGTVIKTTNFGTNWINKSGNGIPSNVNLTNINAVSDSICLIAGNIGTTTNVYRTSNAGNNWITVFTQTAGQINAIKMKTSLVGFMCGNPAGGRWSLYKTSNGGISWDSSGLYLLQSGSETGFNNSMACINNRIWFGTNNARIYFSTNYGLNWTIQSTAPEQNIKAVWFYCIDSTWGNSGGSNLLKTSNSGINWTAGISQGTGDFVSFTWGMPGVLLNPPLIQWCVRGDNKLYRGGYGSNFVIDYTAPSGNYNYLTDAGNYVSYEYGIRSNEGITRFQTLFGGIKKISSEIPQQFSLSQNYPNPFNPSTKIKFSLPLPSKGGVQDIKLIVYDILGHEVASLIPPLWGGHEGLPGTYEVEWNASDYPSGIYFYKLTSRDFSESKKMVLIK